MYDLIIIGAGPSGIFTALESKKNNPEYKILMIEKGNSIDKRICPKRKTGKCINCNPCNITTGFSGAGAFSDGKLSINEHGEIGGDLVQYIGHDNFKELIHYTDDIYLSYGADTKVYGLDNLSEIEAIRTKAVQNNLKLVESGVRHLGTEKAYEIYSKLQQTLLNAGVEIMFKTQVEDILINNGEAIGVKLKDKDIFSKKVIASVGREGSDWLHRLCEKHNIETQVGTVDIGVRMECDSAITNSIDSVSYESKFVNRTKTFEDKVRTFCWNPRGEVTEERYDGNLAVANGHSYKADELKTSNTNFALLVSLNFTEPFKTPIEYGKYIAGLGNMLAGSKVMVQRYGDFKHGRRTTKERLSKNNLQPTLKDATPGDLSLVLPYRIMLDISETIESLNNVMEGFASDDTLLYGVEVKFYSNKVNVNENFETNIKNLYALGDGAGMTRGLMQASCSGVFLGRLI